MVVDDGNRITANIIAGKLKSAYLLAVQLESSAQVSRIRAEAVRLKQQMVVQLCDKYLSGQ